MMFARDTAVLRANFRHVYLGRWVALNDDLRIGGTCGEKVISRVGSIGRYE